jgi:hypothetical protein
MTEKQPEFEPAWLQGALEKAGEEGAKRALASLGLGDAGAAEDLRDLRSTLVMLRTVKAGIGKRIMDAIVTGIVGVLAALFAIGWWGNRP